MSNEKKDSLAAMLEQYQSKSKPRFEKKEEKVYDLKNYFNTFIKDGVKSATKTIRILPTSDGSTPFVEFKGHKRKVDGVWKTFACLKHEKKEDCPFCEARELLLAQGTDATKTLAKDYSAKDMYIVKVIDRDNEAEGVKFWRFNHAWSNEGIMDKIHGIINAIKKDITSAENGRDIVLTIGRNQTNAPVVTGVATLDPTPLSENAEQAAEWLSDTRTWEDVYSVKGYDYLEIIVKGHTPMWDKDQKKFVSKEESEAESKGDGIELELTLGVEDVKASVQASTTVTATESTPTPEAEGDDLPF